MRSKTQDVKLRTPKQFFAIVNLPSISPTNYGESDDSKVWSLQQPMPDTAGDKGGHLAGEGEVATLDGIASPLHVLQGTNGSHSTRDQ